MIEPRGRGPTLAKDINRRTIYNVIKQKRSTSRIELAKMLKLNKNTVNTIVDELIHAGFVQDIGQKKTTSAGRKPTIIEFQAKNKWTLGVHLSSSVIHFAVTDLYAQPLEKFSIPIEQPTPETVVFTIKSALDRITNTYSQDHCIGIGIGIPGLINKNRTHVIQSSHLDWMDVPIIQELQNEIQMDYILLDNSVKLATLGEMWYGMGHGVSNFIYCNFGNGVGCGLISDNKLIRGETNAAGELGHVIIDSHGPKCICGNYGCLETIVGLPFIFERLSKKAAVPIENITMDWVVDQIAANNDLVLSDLEQVGNAIGHSLSQIINLLNPKMIICDGPLMKAAYFLFPIIEQKINSDSVSLLANEVKLERSQLYPMAGCIGAAALMIESWEDEVNPNDLITV
ncbi:ROK family transcriptional regulator [Peribacillus muralis]|uniref:ROK family transcriptional regulator n=1 Tax=Peribacillus muralis TaxID=264697 RepID=UPI001F4E761A|nr:ROK family transcriptional regulator [Peribacillus muralis]MCK1993575.1 ROK family transcriptional regulator [Peribacillus muralis]MCK2014137.1 ROK family transcriptional regulator [Peribacillus muralis]